MKLFKKSTVLANSLDFTYCAEFLTKNVCDFKSLTPEISQELVKWLALHADQDKIGSTDFKTQMLRLYHAEKRTPPVCTKYWVLRGWSLEDAQAKVHLSQGSKFKSSLLYYSNLSPEAAEIERAKWQGDTRNKNKRNLEAQGLDATSFMLERDRKASFRTADFWEAKGLSADEVREKLKEVQGKTWSEAKREAHKINSKRSTEYYLSRGASAEQAQIEVAKNQATFTLAKCIIKLGKAAGLKRWQDRQTLWHKNYKKSNYSQVSQRLFRELVQTAPTCIFAESLNNGKNVEHVFRTTYGSVYKLDFWVPETKHLIEFDGDYWHSLVMANPEREAKRTAQILETDPAIKIMHVQELDFNKNPAVVIQRCIEFLNS